MRMRIPASNRARVALIIALLALAFAVRVGAAVIWEARLPVGARFAFPDSETYWTLGQRLATGAPYSYGPHEARVFRMPGYPWVLSIVFRCCGADTPTLAARVLGALLGTMAIAGVAWMAWQLFGPAASLATAVLAAVYPGAIVMSVLLLSESPFCAVMTWQLALGVAAWNSPAIRSRGVLSLLFGLVGGMATWIRPSWLLFTPIACLIGLTSRRSRGDCWQFAWCAVMGLVLTMAPWWWRNYTITGHWVPTTLQVGASLYDGWNPLADGGSDMRFVDRFLDEQRRADEAALAAGQTLDATFEWRLDQRHRAAAVAWALGYPGQVLRLMGVKFLRMWNVWPNEPAFRGWWVRCVVLIGYVPLMIAAAWGAVTIVSRRGGAHMFCLLPAVYLTLLHVIFVSSLRYREPAMLPLIVLAAAVMVCERTSHGERPS